ncbi:molybdopterin containing oxidoreductase [Falsiroseomonas bella]|uniref:Molybdopterin containing oxidoreductase n=1 Tax=Falsiroseomonas bella TaxID=2184016 RepID=A0A317FJB2_9PROT|nr:sulfite oxidase [Falsiroseomonas bella]PWS38855.1 molybdopterin containing oxidoreductase [Falsiroseomonas bella]
MTLRHGKAERSIQELYRDDPERADAVAFGRRGALKGTALAAMGGMLGAAIPFAGRMPEGTLPALFARPAAAQGAAPAVLRMEGKAPLILQQERPLVGETPEHLLDEPVTSYANFFIRNNGGIPDPVADPRTWKLRIDGEVNTPLELTMGDLESRFPVVTRQLQMECGGNGRAFFAPQTRGNQWGNGAIGNAEWTGVRLRDVLQAAGAKETARYTGHFGADPHLSGAADRAAISRGMRMAKAMDEDTLIVFRMNGQPIPHIHGAPLRLLVPGWPGSLSQKWLTRVTLLSQPHTGAGMGGTSYRMPVRPIVPGSNNNGADFADMESMPVRSILSSHAHGTRLPAGTRSLDLRGAAWAGDLTVRAVHASVDFGATWTEMQVAAPANRHAWQRWTGRVALPSDGYYEIWYRATDSEGRMQPHAPANWNPQGYGANPISRAAILVG